MSEYQYYEFQSLDGPLTANAREEMKSLSSRVQLSSNSASFVYNYGDFRGDPYQVLAKHFDVMLYIANWGTRRLMFRFPADAVPTAVREVYQYAESMDWSQSGDYIILDILQETEEPFGWLEGEGLLPRIAPVRNQIMRGDYRGLYLAWLVSVVDELYVLEDDEDLTEPPAPAGLTSLAAALQSFVNFFEVDTDLVAAAAQGSSSDNQPKTQLSDSLAQLPEQEKLDYLGRLLAGEAHLDVALAKRLREIAGQDIAPLPKSEKPRTLRQLMKLAEQIKAGRRDKKP